LQLFHAEVSTMPIRHLLASSLIALAGVTTASATSVTVLPDGAWNEFFVADPAFNLGNPDLSWIDITDYSNASFTFTVDPGKIGTLTVVDGGFSGDTFHVYSGGLSMGDTSVAVNSAPSGTNLGNDYAAALANSDFSRGIYSFGAGTYTITGSLAASALDDAGAPLNSTLGALKLEVAAVPEASTLAMLMAGLGVVGLVACRRSK
jgi:hypothetical protein